MTKKAYRKRKFATSAAKNMKKNYNKEYVVYKCSYCDYLHISTYKKSNKNIENAKGGGRFVYSTNGVF
tara:strand:+ start:3008 stop:3211 length:204 start_codon:yes stop_codon:yes gene_type:complete